MRYVIQPPTLREMIQRAYAPETQLPVKYSTHPNRSFILLLAMVASLGIAPLIVAYFASSML